MCGTGLSERHWECGCGVHHDRDVNAAVNALLLGLGQATHIGEYALPEPTADDRAAMFERYKAQPNPLEGRGVIAVHV